MELLTKIINEKIPCFFISPHLDDAILSAGGMISYLANKTKVTVITIFTTGNSPPHTRFAKKYMKTCNYKDVNAYFGDRKEEDIQVLKSIQVNFQHLDFIDAAYRKKGHLNKLHALFGSRLPELIHLYPFNSSLRSGKIDDVDENIIKDIKRSLINLLNSKFEYRNPKQIQNLNDQNSKKTSFENLNLKNSNLFRISDLGFRIFCPLAIGNHVDHVIVRDLCVKLFKQNLIFWTDYPYINWENTAEDFIKKLKLKSFIWEKNLDKKRKLILGYKSQISALFPKKVPFTFPSEVFYMS